MKTRNKKKTNALEKKFTIFEQDLRNGFAIEGASMIIMEGLEDKVSPELLELLKQMLLGFNNDMQLEMADNLLDFACGQVIHTTGCNSADVILAACYTWIAAEKGIDLSTINNK